MSAKQTDVRAIVAKGWTLMFIVFLGLFVVDLTKSAIFQSFAKWEKDPGYFGLQVLVVMMCIYAAMPMLVMTISGKWFRGLTAGVTGFFTLFFIAHELTHLASGDKPFSVMHALDICHHVLGIWTMVAAIIWTKRADAEALAADAARTVEAPGPVETARAVGA